MKCHPKILNAPYFVPQLLADLSYLHARIDQLEDQLAPKPEPHPGNPEIQARDARYEAELDEVLGDRSKKFDRAIEEIKRHNQTIDDVRSGLAGSNIGIELELGRRPVTAETAHVCWCGKVHR